MNENGERKNVRAIEGERKAEEGTKEEEEKKEDAGRTVAMKIEGRNED